MFSGTLIVVEAVDVLPSKPVAVIVYVILPPGAAAFTVAYGIVFVPLSRGTVPTPLSITKNLALDDVYVKIKSVPDESEPLTLFAIVTVSFSAATSEDLLRSIIS